MDAKNKITKDITYLKEKVDFIKIAMLTTKNQDGNLTSRPMTTLKMDDEGNLWFFINKQSFIRNEIAQQQSVNLSYVDPAAQCYISVSGIAEQIEDKAMKEALWKPSFETWFPGGMGNPDLCLIKIKMRQVEHWDLHTNSMNLLFKVTDSILSGNAYVKGEQGEFSSQA